MRWLVRMVAMIFLALLSVQQIAAAQEASALSNSDKAALGQLANVLENSQQRDALIAELRRVAGNSQSSSEAQNQTSDNAANSRSSASPSSAISTFTNALNPTASASEETANTSTQAADNNAVSAGNAITQAATSVPRKLAEKTASLARQIGMRINTALQNTVSIFRGEDLWLNNVDLSHFGSACLRLLFIVLLAIGLYQGFRFFMRPIKQRINGWSLGSAFALPIVRKVIAIFIVACGDSAFLGLTYLLCNGILLIFPRLSLSIEQALFLNAFVIIELLKIADRMVWYPHYPGIRLMKEGDSIARFWYHWTANLIGFVGYGFLVVVPLINSNLGYSLGQVVSTTLAFAAFIYGIWGIMSRRKRVTKRFQEWATNAHTPVTRVFFQFLSLMWFWLAFAYLTMLLVVTILRAGFALPFVLQGTLKTIAIVVVWLLFDLLTRHMIEHRIQLPPTWRRNMPGLESRLNTYVPLLLRFIRIVLFVGILCVFLSVWHIVDIEHWFSSLEGQEVIDKWLGVFWIVFMSLALWIIITTIVENWLSPETGKGVPSPRMTTILSLSRSAFLVLLTSGCIMMVLSQIGINIAPLIAGAGVIGLAVGFGAQTLVKDVITGIFIQLENAINTGDYVTVCGISGTAENISIRSLGLRDLEGTYHLIPFSSVTTVSNFNRGFAYHVGIYGIGYNENIDAAFEQLQAAFDELTQSEYRQNILEPITISGVTELADSSVNIRVMIKTSPGDQWRVGRAYNRLVKIYFDRAGIEIPFPHQTIYFGQNKDSSAPPVNVRVKNEDFDASGLPESSIRKAKALREKEKNRDINPDSSLQSKGDAQTNQGDIDSEL